MHRFRGLCLALALVTAAAPAAELTDAAAVLKYAAAKNASYESYSAAFAQSLAMGATKMQLTGTIAFKRPAQMRLEMNGPPQRMVLVIGADQILWQEVIIGGMTNVMKMDLQTVPTNHPAAAMLKDSFSRMDPKDQLDKANERYSFALLPATELHGQPMYVLTGELRADAKIAPSESVLTTLGKEQIFIGQQDGFLHRMEQFDKAGHTIVSSMEFTNIKLNTPLADNLFRYRPSPVANVIDMTQIILQMLSRPPKPPATGN